MRGRATCHARGGVSASQWLALTLFSPILAAACFVLNVRPRQGGLGPTVSRSWLWITRPPSLCTLLAMPGLVVRVQVSPTRVIHGLYICPNDDIAGHTVFCLDSRVLVPVSQVMADVDPFRQTITRTPSLKSDLLWPARLDSLIRDDIGSPSIFGDETGLATLEWIATLVPQPPLAADDLPDLMDADSDDDVEVVSPTAADFTPRAVALKCGPPLPMPRKDSASHFRLRCAASRRHKGTASPDRDAGCSCR